MGGEYKIHFYQCFIFLYIQCVVIPMVTAHLLVKARMVVKQILILMIRLLQRISLRVPQELISRIKNDIHI